MNQLDSTPIGAEFTGHPFFDVGLATMTAFVGKSHPCELTAEDLDQVASYIEEQYVQSPLKGYLTMAFTSNAWFIQDGFNPDRPELTSEQREVRRQTRAMWAGRHLREWVRGETSATEKCVFTGLPAVAVALSGKLPEGRAGRAQTPLLQGDDSINFFAEGQSGIPVSGLALLALQFFPLGCAKAGLGLLAVHSESERLTLRFARSFWKQTSSDIALARAAGESKMPNAGRSPKTLLVDTLLNVEEELQREARREAPSSLTAYNFNNGKTPDLRLYHLPLQTVDFLRSARTATFADAWSEITRRAWQVVNEEKNGKRDGGALRGPRYNTLYEDLFTLPEQAPRFIRTYFLRIPRHSKQEGDPTANYSPQQEVSLVSWALVELFLGKVTLMEQSRIDQIRMLGDRLARYTRQRGGYQFFRAFFTERNPAFLRDRLLNANVKAVRAGEEQLFTMDSYIEVFEEGEELYRRDWRLARDLVLMRMIDQLKDWLVQNPGALSEPDDDESDDA